MLIGMLSPFPVNMPDHTPVTSIAVRASTFRVSSTSTTDLSDSFADVIFPVIRSPAIVKSN